MDQNIIDRLRKLGYFYHPGGDLPGTLNLFKKPGIWKKIPGPVEAVYIAETWEEAEEYSRLDD